MSERGIGCPCACCASLVPALREHADAIVRIKAERDEARAELRAAVEYIESTIKIVAHLDDARPVIEHVNAVVARMREACGDKGGEDGGD